MKKRKIKKKVRKSFRKIVSLHYDDDIKKACNYMFKNRQKAIKILNLLHGK